MKHHLKMVALAVAAMSLVMTGRADDTCFRFYSIGASTKVGLRNTSEQCKIAVISFSYYNGKHELKEFKVPGKSSIEIDTKGSSLTEIIDHKDCK